MSQERFSIFYVPLIVLAFGVSAFEEDTPFWSLNKIAKRSVLPGNLPDFTKPDFLAKNTVTSMLVSPQEVESQIRGFSSIASQRSKATTAVSSSSKESGRLGKQPLSVDVFSDVVATGKPLRKIQADKDLGVETAGLAEINRHTAARAVASDSQKDNVKQYSDSEGENKGVRLNGILKNRIVNGLSGDSHSKNIANFVHRTKAGYSQLANSQKLLPDIQEHFYRLTGQDSTAEKSSYMNPSEIPNAASIEQRGLNLMQRFTTASESENGAKDSELIQGISTLNSYLPGQGSRLETDTTTANDVPPNLLLQPENVSDKIERFDVAIKPLAKLQETWKQNNFLPELRKQVYSKIFSVPSDNTRLPEDPGKVLEIVKSRPSWKNNGLETLGRDGRNLHDKSDRRGMLTKFVTEFEAFPQKAMEKSQSDVHKAIKFGDRNMKNVIHSILKKLSAQTTIPGIKADTIKHGIISPSNIQQKEPIERSIHESLYDSTVSDNDKVLSFMYKPSRGESSPLVNTTLVDNQKTGRTYSSSPTGLNNYLKPLIKVGKETLNNLKKLSNISFNDPYTKFQHIYDTKSTICGNHKHCNNLAVAYDAAKNISNVKPNPDSDVKIILYKSADGLNPLLSAGLKENISKIHAPLNVLRRTAYPGQDDLHYRLEKSLIEDTNDLFNISGASKWAKDNLGPTIKRPNCGKPCEKFLSAIFGITEDVLQDQKSKDTPSSSESISTKKPQRENGGSFSNVNNANIHETKGPESNTLTEVVKFPVVTEPKDKKKVTVVVTIHGGNENNNVFDRGSVSDMLQAKDESSLEAVKEGEVVTVPVEKYQHPENQGKSRGIKQRSLKKVVITPAENHQRVKTLEGRRANMYEPSKRRLSKGKKKVYFTFSSEEDETVSGGQYSFPKRNKTHTDYWKPVEESKFLEDPDVREVIYEKYPDQLYKSNSTKKLEPNVDIALPDNQKKQTFLLSSSEPYTTRVLRKTTDKPHSFTKDRSLESNGSKLKVTGSDTEDPGFGEQLNKILKHLELHHQHGHRGKDDSKEAEIRKYVDPRHREKIKRHLNSIQHTKQEQANVLKSSAEDAKDHLKNDKMSYFKIDPIETYVNHDTDKSKAHREKYNDYVALIGQLSPDTSVSTKVYKKTEPLFSKQGNASGNTQEATPHAGETDDAKERNNPVSIRLLKDLHVPEKTKERKNTSTSPIQKRKDRGKSDEKAFAKNKENTPARSVVDFLSGTGNNVVIMDRPKEAKEEKLISLQTKRTKPHRNQNLGLGKHITNNMGSKTKMTKDLNGRKCIVSNPKELVRGDKTTEKSYRYLPEYGYSGKEYPTQLVYNGKSFFKPLPLVLVAQAFHVLPEGGNQNQELLTNNLRSGAGNVLSFSSSTHEKQGIGRITTAAVGSICKQLYFKNGTCIRAGDGIWCKVSTDVTGHPYQPESKSDDIHPYTNYHRHYHGPDGKIFS